MTVHYRDLRPWVATTLQWRPPTHLRACLQAHSGGMLTTLKIALESWGNVRLPPRIEGQREVRDVLEAGEMRWLVVQWLCIC